jgi:hypothetical protein
VPSDALPSQVWELDLNGDRHRVEVRGSISRSLRWYVNDELAVEKRSSDDRVRLRSRDRPALGVVLVRFSGLGRPRRATLFDSADGNADVRTLAGLGGIDLEPAAGSPAARYEEQVRAHPRRYAIIKIASGIATVVVPIVLATLVARWAFSLPLPDWNLPDLPRPDLPDLPLPDLSLPGWVRSVLNHAGYVVPIIVALVLARAEIQRRKKQDELRSRRSSRDIN